MKKLVFLILVIILSFNAQAQKGMELRIGGGVGFLGKDPWIETGLITASALYNINGVLAIGPVHTTGVATTFRIDSDKNKFDASISEIALWGQFTVLRSGKFKVYGAASLAYIKGKTDPVPDFINFSGGTIVLEDSAVGLGLGTGVLLNLGGGFYFNLIDLHIRMVGSEFMDMDKGFEGSIGPFYKIQTAISYTFKSN